MSIIVRGMSMPENCDDCQMRQINLARCLITWRSTSHYPSGKPINEKKRPEWCPLVELPEKHGRLIDADAFAEFIEDAIKSQRYKYVTVDGTLTVADVLTAVIDDLKGNTIVKYESNPTVIEAEGEE